MTSRAVRLLVAISFLAGAIVLILYGLFAVLYNSDSGSSGTTYVTLFRRELNAHLVGGIALAVGLFVALFSLRLVRRK